MAIQYSDTVFSENMPVNLAIEKMNSLLEKQIPFQAVHFGTDVELTQRKNALIEKAELQRQIDEIKEQLEKAQVRPISKLLHIPTDEEIKQFT